MEIVEKYCLKCDIFMGKEHNFSKCQTFDKWQNGGAYKLENKIHGSIYENKL